MSSKANRLIVGDFKFDPSKAKVHLAFYKDNYALWSPLIKWWTSAPYSHCEFYIEYLDEGHDYPGELVGISDDQKVRRLKYDMSRELHKWDIYEVCKDNFEMKANLIEKLKEVYHETQGSKYDWKGILLSGIFNRRKHSENRYTCSEWCSIVLDRTLDKKLFYPKWYNVYTPGDVYTTYLDYFK